MLEGKIVNCNIFSFFSDFFLIFFFFLTTSQLSDPLNSCKSNYLVFLIFDILQIPDLAVTEDNFKTVWDMNKDGQLDLTELITNVYTFALVQ